MPKTSSDNAAGSKSAPESAEQDESDQANTEDQSDYYYDDATGYEIYEDDDQDDESEG